MAAFISLAGALPSLPGLYVVDHLFFALAFALKTYFQKIASPGDIAPDRGRCLYDQPYCGSISASRAGLSLGCLTCRGLWRCRRDERRCHCCWP